MSIREVNAVAITDAVEELCIRANTQLPPDVKQALDNAHAAEPWLLGLPVIQQRNDLVFHFPRGLVLAEILFQFRTIDDHLVYLLFLLRQNTVDHIAVELAFLVQLPHFLRLRQRGRGLLPLNGHGDIPLIFGADE